MIDIIQEVIETGSELESENCRQARMRLSFALFDLEIALHLFNLTKAGDADYKDCLRDFNEALENYWRIDAEVTAYLEHAQGTTEATSNLIANTLPMSPERRTLIKALHILEAAPKPTKNTLSATAGSGFFAAIGRFISNPGRMVAAK